MLAILVAALLACSGGGSGGAAVAGVPVPDLPAVDVGTVIARVGDGVVGSADFGPAAARREPADGKALSLEERKEVLEGLVDEEVLFQQAVRRGLFRDAKVRKSLVSTLLRLDVYEQVRSANFTDEELRAYFESHADEFVVPEKMQVKRLFLSVDATNGDAVAAKIKELHAQLVAAPEKFKDLAIQHSMDPYKRRGGDLGFLTREGKPGIDPKVVEVGFSLQPGRVSDPFEAGGGWNVVQAVAYRERVDRPFEQLKGAVIRKKKNLLYEDLQKTYIGKLRADLTVSVDEAALMAAPIDARPAPEELRELPGLGDDVEGAEQVQGARPPEFEREPRMERHP
jgi:parvulin-like peptidyl-prolyl isomerase